MYEQILNYFYIYILPPAAALVTGAVGGYILHAKKWWGNKTRDEQRDAIKDAIICMWGLHPTPEKICALIDEHIFDIPEQPKEEVKADVAK